MLSRISLFLASYMALTVSGISREPHKGVILHLLHSTACSYSVMGGGTSYLQVGLSDLELFRPWSRKVLPRRNLGPVAARVNAKRGVQRTVRHVRTAVSM